MELVEGEPITAFCAKHELTLEQRLRLFMPVCQAVQHAHQKGIIHRDLKPSNVLVTFQDGLPVPKVIDFGVAKAINQRLTEKTLFTQHATMIGTPAYMSPEQAELSGVDVDTRSDIYSLGVLLYELLTGTQPFPEQRLRSVAYAEMQRIILHEEPERPSTRLTRELAPGSARGAPKTRSVRATAGTGDPAGRASGEPPEAAREPRALPKAGPETACGPRGLPGDARAAAQALRGDLDWIILKCLEKDRNRRYETANGLAADLGRFLGHEPVVARPPNRWYAFRKTMRRHRVGFAATAAVIAALAVALIVSAWQSTRVIREQARTKLQLQATVELLGETFDNVVPALAHTIGAAKAREELAKAAARIVEKLPQATAPPTEMRRVLAQLYLHLAYIESNYSGTTTGEFAEGLANAQKAMRLFELPGWESGEDARRFGLANAEMCAGLAARGLLQFEEAFHHFESMERWADRLKASSDPTAKERGRERGEAARWLAGMTLLSRGRADTAMTDYFRPLLADFERRERLGEQNERPSSEDWRDMYDSLGRCDSRLGQRPEAERWFRHALPFAAALVEDNPSHSKYACYLAESKARLGETLLALGKPAEALPLLEESAQMAQSLRKRDPRNPGFVELQVNVLQSHVEGYVAWAADPAAPPEERTRRLDRGQAYLDQATRLVAGLSSASFRRFLDAGLRGTAAALEQAGKPLGTSPEGDRMDGLPGPTP